MSTQIPATLVKEVLCESLGKEHISVMKQLSQPKYDEDIASELGMKATIVRTLLNDLHEQNLVEYERIKNKSTGWYTYIWKKREDKLRDYVKGYLEMRINQMSSDLENEKSGLFKCSCKVVSLEQAMESNFICPFCNETFKASKNSSRTRELKKEIERSQKLFEKLH